MYDAWNRTLGNTWSPVISWCVACGATLPGEAFVESCGEARCPSCRRNLELDVADGPTTAFLTRFVPLDSIASRDGPAESGLCPYWIDLEEGRTLTSREVGHADSLAPLVPCRLRAHDGDAHEWDPRSRRATIEARDSRVGRPPPPRDPRGRRRGPRELGSTFRALRDRVGITRADAAALYGERWGRGGTRQNVSYMERYGGSPRQLRRAEIAYGLEGAT